MQLDIVMLSPIQMHSLLADAIYDSNGLISLDAWVPGAARLCMKMFDPQLEAKRLTVGKMAKVTPLQALTGPEKERLSSMAASVFATYDNDNSGKLDRDEFMRCLTESKLGLTERQISHMMAAADVSEDGLIDYSEFADLFNNCILELARLDAVDKMLYAEDAAATIEKGITLLLDECLIPLHIAFDIALEGKEELSTEGLVALLNTKGPEWGIPDIATDALCTAIAGSGVEAYAWGALVAFIEKLVMG